ncbi:YfiT family bacillithiol transferase [Roseivirga sp.]|uniref:YfiT family bacillithiol transferase n=1 Tax=Roseivirga sp. TaxID=1964215 RepID=UPI003B520671
MSQHNLSFPIGPFKAPEVISQEVLAGWIQEIDEVPYRYRQAVQSLTDEQLDTPYRPDGWTVRQVIHHVPDSHLNSYIRFHWALTEDQPTIKAYDEKAWAELSYQQEVPVRVSLGLLESIHARWVILLRQMTEADLEKAFIHPESKAVLQLKTVIGMYAWHGEHHLQHILQLKERKGW